MSDTAVADPKTDGASPVGSMDYHIDSMFDDDFQDESADEVVAEPVVEEESADAETGDASQDGGEGTTVSAEKTTTAEVAKEPQTVEEYKEELAKAKAAHEAEVSKLRTSIDKQGNRFMGIQEKNKQLEQQLAQIQAQRQKLGARPDFLEDHEGATIHAVKSNTLAEQEQAVQAQITRNQSVVQKVTVEQAAATKFAPEHAEMIADLHALWKRDVPDYEGTLNEFQSALYSDIPASAIISMTKRVVAERERDEARAKLQEVMDKYTKAGKSKPRLVTPGSGQAHDSFDAADDDDDDILAYAHNPDLYASKHKRR